MNTDSDLDLIIDMFNFNTTYDDEIESDKEEEYYCGKAENILKQLSDNDNYYIFLKIIMKKFHELKKE